MDSKTRKLIQLIDTEIEQIELQNPPTYLSEEDIGLIIKVYSELRDKALNDGVDLEKVIEESYLSTDEYVRTLEKSGSYSSSDSKISNEHMHKFFEWISKNKPKIDRFEEISESIQKDKNIFWPSEKSDVSDLRIVWDILNCGYSWPMT